MAKTSSENKEVRICTLEKRLEKMECRFEKFELKIDKIMTNHLPHIEIALVQLRTKQNVMTAINVGTIILALVIQKMFFQ